MTRKPRKKPKNRKIDFMKPLTLKEFGSEKDPCFGKHYSLKADECARCGDYEACSVLSQSKMIADMNKEEKQNPYKDTVEGMLVDSQNAWVKKQVLKRAKAKEGTWLSIDKLVPRFREHCNLTEMEDRNLFQRIANAAKSLKKKGIEQKGSKYRYVSND